MRLKDDDSAPLTADQFTALMAPFAPFERGAVLGVALSGGRDSLCLAVLADEWAKAREGRAVALIVDHGLRRESAEEARFVCAMVEGLGIEGDVLCWTGGKPAHGIQEAARTARYGLLVEACRQRGILHLLVGHHAGDQAETVTMRRARGSGPDGLAGMAAQVEHRDVRLLRPLLPVSRDRLTATLVVRGLQWIDDPSNADLRFERVRLRDGRPLEAQMAAEAGDRRAWSERRLAEAAVAVLAFAPEGLAIDCADFADLEADMAARLLSRAVQAVGGGNHPPRRDRLARAVKRLRGAAECGRSGNRQDFTLSGCRLVLRPAGKDARLCWIVRPESGRKSLGKGGQPLVPAAFFACRAPVRTHLD